MWNDTLDFLKLTGLFFCCALAMLATVGVFVSFIWAIGSL